MNSWGAAITGILLPIALILLCLRQRTFTLTAGLAMCLVTTSVAFLCGWEWALALDTHLLGIAGWVPFRRGVKAEALDRPGAMALWGTAEVLAPITWPTVTALANAYLGRSDVAFAIFAGALAASSADLWATEIGVLSSQPPRDLIRGIAMPPGVAGAVSLLGLVAAISGAWSLGLVAMASRTLPPLIANRPMNAQWGLLPLACTCAGLMGTVADSALGGIAQAMYYCPRCERATDQPQHHCGARTEKVRGWRGLTNPRVDLLSSMIGGIVALVFWMWLA